MNLKMGGGDEMFREIKKKKLILENRKPYRDDVRRFMDEMDRADWIYSSLRLDGSPLKRAEVEQIISGEFLIDVPVTEHAAIGSFSDTIRMLYDMSEMNISLDEKYLRKIHASLTDEETDEYRRNNPVLRMISYNPPHFNAIEEQLTLLFRWLASDASETNPIEKAAYLHNKLIEIYPFETGSEATARAAAQYYLITNGFPPILWNISEQEYYDAIRLYLKNEEIAPIREVLERGVYNKLDVMLQLTAE
jgi:Fic family protein